MWNFLKFYTIFTQILKKIFQNFILRFLKYSKTFFLPLCNFTRNHWCSALETFEEMKIVTNIFGKVKQIFIKISMKHKTMMRVSNVTGLISFLQHLVTLIVLCSAQKFSRLVRVCVTSVLILGVIHVNQWQRSWCQLGMAIFANINIDIVSILSSQWYRHIDMTSIFPSIKNHVLWIFHEVHCYPYT